MTLLKLLVLVHVLSAVIGIGPTYFTSVLLRPGQSVSRLRAASGFATQLEVFPKVGGTLAVLSGLLLVWLGQYGRVTQLWLLGSLLLYVAIQAVIVGVAVPRTRRLEHGLTALGASPVGDTLSAPQARLLTQVYHAHLLATALGTVLFILMILRPA